MTRHMAQTPPCVTHDMRENRKTLSNWRLAMCVSLFFCDFRVSVAGLVVSIGAFHCLVVRLVTNIKNKCWVQISSQAGSNKTSKKKRSTTCFVMDVGVWCNC